MTKNQNPGDTAPDAPTHATPVHASVLPLGALLLAGTLGTAAMAQPAEPAAGTLGTVTVHGAADDGSTTSKALLRAKRTEIGKGEQELRDIPQSVTVMTEKLIQERKLDDFREVLRATAGVTFQAGETGEEDVRMRGFSLGQAGDIYRDGMRDAPLYERDTFNDDRVEVIKGSASMLFGKGSTGGVVNQVSKQPFLLDQHEASVTLGTGELKRLQGDFNWETGEHSALRLNLLGQHAKNWGAKQRKIGFAPTFRWGMGQRNEFFASLYYLDIKGRSTYAHPWIIGEDGTINATLPAKNFYGLQNDHLDTSAVYATLGHTHRFEHDGQLRTRVRAGRFERDLLGSPIRFEAPAPSIVDDITDSTALTRASKGRVGKSNVVMLQSDYSGRHELGGREHHILAGVEYYDEDAKRNNNYPLTGALPGTTVGSPNDGAWAPDLRERPMPRNTFKARNISLYAQDTAQLGEHVKLVAGVRMDHFRASYNTLGSTARDGTVTPPHHFSRSDTLLSPRIGLLYQPNPLASYYVSYGTSYNTSGDTYQFTPGGPNQRLGNTPAEKSRNIELGGKWELFDQRVTAGAALFYSEKFNERNTDPDTASEQELLSGKRHAAGMEFNLAGHVTPRWEVFWNHTWIPNAKIDRSNVALNPAGTGAQVEGDRPGLTPRHSGSFWTTYRVQPQFRVGLGANYRSSQNPEGQRSYRAKSFITFDAMAEYSFDHKTSLKLNVTNLTNKRYVDGLYRGFYQPGEPRRFELTLTSLF